MEETLIEVGLDETKSVMLIRKVYYDAVYIDLRTFFYRKGCNDPLPSKKGVIMRLDQWEYIFPSLCRALGVELADAD